MRLMRPTLAPLSRLPLSSLALDILAGPWIFKNYGKILQLGLQIRANYVEAHGTETAVGNPIEFETIAAALSPQAEAEKLPIRPIKGNIGHTEGAIGLADLIKAVFMLENNMISLLVNFQKANPKILLNDWNMWV
ncbi:thiolase-like protein [Trichoderma evansii]